MIYVSLEEVLDLHDGCIQNHGGLRGIRDKGALESAIMAPQTILFGQEMYPSIIEKSCVYLWHLIKNHPFNDGNKRTAAATFLFFLEANQHKIPSDNEIFNFCFLITEQAVDKLELMEIFSKLNK